uniref:Gamma carbonic anhydrase n=1 Tax=Polytomella parva TaxID=51329 RepID=A0A7S0YK00_9CHLO|nr:Chain y, CA2 [Polytomella sp. Pringsheim 198.80]7ARD_y Chain y, CA2 [Polytomella sp. Pringsheim 198.80]|mmetsp:Transcript_30271/g.55295  ORF Transcript_30271/g.55295 Transcript_30271/m.55295 type:complete len:311 (+) Transcript_30271:88-1020(+)
MSLLKNYPPSYLYPFRHPKPEGVIEKVLFNLGSLFRSAGQGMDELGSLMLGNGGMQESVGPNLAYAPVKYNPAAAPKAGIVAPIPASAQRVLGVKEIVLPSKAESTFIAPNANVLGDVKIGAKSSIWYGAVLRGDVNSIEIGDNTNVQDNVTIHVAKHSIDGKLRNTVIGNNVTIGHCATIHACTIADNVIIGMGATVLDGVKVESGSIVGAGSIVPPNTVIPAGQVWVGNPAKFIRNVLPEENGFIASSANNYDLLGQQHKFENSKVFEEMLVEEEIAKDRELLEDKNLAVHQLYIFDPQTQLAARPRR